MNIFEDKLCQSRVCDTILTGKQKKYCSKDCCTNEKRLRDMENTQSDILQKINRSLKEYSDHECRYCKDSEHSGFCSFRHEYSYFQIMAPINTALGR